MGIRLAGTDPLIARGDDPAFLRRAPSGAMVALRVQPRARRVSLACTADGALRAMVTAPPEDGKANQAVIELLAAAWRLPKSAMAIARGAAARDKVVSIAGEPAALAARIAQWMKDQDTA